jgi:DNA-binding transcriptional ArsR family regulator
MLYKCTLVKRTEQPTLALKALGEPRRVDILRLLRSGPRAVGEIAAEVDVTQQAASQHLAVLGKPHFFRHEWPTGGHALAPLRGASPGRGRGRRPERTAHGRRDPAEGRDPPTSRRRGFTAWPTGNAQRSYAGGHERTRRDREWGFSLAQPSATRFPPLPIVTILEENAQERS